MTPPISSAANSQTKRWFLVLAASTMALVFSGIGLYRTIRPTSYDFAHPPTKDLELVDNPRPFINETIEVDGKNFQNCTFTNVRLVFQGKKTETFQNNKFYGTIVIATPNHGIAAFAELISAFGIFKDQSVI